MTVLCNGVEWNITETSCSGQQSQLSSILLQIQYRLCWYQSNQNDFFAHFVAVTCPVLNLTHAVWSDNGNHFGDSVTFTCDEGYQYKTKKAGVIKCQANAEWSGDAKGCRRM